MDRSTIQELGRDEEIIFPPTKEQSMSSSRSRQHASRGKHEKYEEHRHRRYPQSYSTKDERYWWEQVFSFVM